MTEKKRRISLGFTGAMFDEGHHIIYIYNNDAERKRTMAKFLQQGFLENEKLLYLVADIPPAEIRREFLKLGVNVEERQKDFDIAPGHHACCPEAYFSSDFMLDLVGDYYENAIKEGYAGARGAGEMSWALLEGRSTVPELMDYEARLNTILKDHPLTTVCQYDVRKFDSALIMDLLSVHPMMIVRGQLVRNPVYVEPEIFLQQNQKRMNGPHE